MFLCIYISCTRARSVFRSSRRSVSKVTPPCLTVVLRWQTPGRRFRRLRRSLPVTRSLLLFPSFQCVPRSPFTAYRLHARNNLSENVSAAKFHDTRRTIDRNRANEPERTILTATLTSPRCPSGTRTTILSSSRIGGSPVLPRRTRVASYNSLSSRSIGKQLASFPPQTTSNGKRCRFFFSFFFFIFFFPFSFSVPSSHAFLPQMLFRSRAEHDKYL